MWHTVKSIGADIVGSRRPRVTRGETPSDEQGSSKEAIREKSEA